MPGTGSSAAAETAHLSAAMEFGCRPLEATEIFTEANAETQPMASISEQLREAIKSSGQSYYALAQQTGVDAAVILRFVNGQRDLRLETAAKLAKELGLDLRSRK